MGMNNFISMFSGAGGLDLGFEQAGWNRLFASDLDTDAVATLRANAKMEKVASVGQDDIRDLTARDILAHVGDVSKGDLDAIVGGPPCQSWSSAGHQMGLADTRGQLFRHFIKLANSLDPRFIVMENVRGLLTARGPDGEPGSALTLLRDDLRREGWQTAVNLLNAADFGVAQRRVRLFIIAHRMGDAPQFPAPTHSREAVNGLNRWVTLKQCLSNIQSVCEEEIVRPTPKLAAELAQIKPGSGVKSPGKAEATRPGGHWGYKQGAFIADPSLPARTVTASTAQDWIIDPVHGLRRLCPRECAALQSFPAAWKWQGKRASLYRQIGNAVPPKLAKAVAESLVDHLAQSAVETIDRTMVDELTPLDTRLMAAITYTKRDEARNGESRRSAPTLRRRRAS
ncbi:MAG: DNA cytosine methyltransferase [Hyphomicrobiales bacterium]|jgi:DNA (cytosine-5)-methyltransferase 1